MVANHSTQDQTGTLRDCQTMDAAKRAAAIIQQQAPAMSVDEPLETVFLETGAGLVLGIDTAGRFTLAGEDQSGRPLLTLTPDETQALLRFWIPIVANVLMDRMAASVGVRTEQQSKAEVLELLAQREDARIRERAVELTVAPNCQPEILTFPPRVVTIDGTQFLPLKGNEGWESGYPDGWECGYSVLEVTRMDAHDGLVLVATPEQVFLMTAEDFDTPAE